MTERGRLIAASVLLMSMLAIPSHAQIEAQITVGTPPPPPRVVVVPPARAGLVYAPGYWEWRHNHYRWHDATWVEARPGFVYAPAEWVPEGRSWRYVPGHWVESGPPGRLHCPPGQAKKGRC